MKLNLIKQRSLWWGISATFILAGIMAMVISTVQLGAPLRLGLDFIGGTRLQLQRDCTQPGNCDEPIETAVVREVMTAQGLGDSNIQIIQGGGEQPILSIRSKTLDVEERSQLETTLKQKIGAFDPKSTQIDTVGPTLGKELLASGLLALLLAFVGILIYLTFRFKFDYAFFAFVALFHDVLITVGIFSIFGLVVGLEVNTLFIVALLTIIGFSVNDTVVIYDRVREVIKFNPKQPINQVVEEAVNQTLTRSINTTLTTILPLLAIFLFGGETLKYFALTLIIGFISGAYSSIFIASTLLAFWRERNPQPQPPEPESVVAETESPSITDTPSTPVIDAEFSDEA
ncbi:MAG: protein translocase subunit SecF [Symploca sp. SIO2C1]|nr:protein translocase subunit SecF [Symploca sp. SIO2C1]